MKEEGSTLLNSYKNMNKLTHSFRLKAFAGIVVFVFIFSLGAIARPGIDLVSDVIEGVFAPSKPEYIAPVSEYETKVNDLWHSDKHQATCRANAAAKVSLELTDKYMQEAKKQILMADYDISDSVAKETNRIESARKSK